MTGGGGALMTEGRGTHDIGEGHSQQRGRVPYSSGVCIIIHKEHQLRTLRDNVQTNLQNKLKVVRMYVKMLYSPNSTAPAAAMQHTQA